MDETEFSEGLDNLITLDLEYRLAIGMCTMNDYKCAEYLTRRRPVLVPEILKEAAKQGKDPIDLFTEFRGKLHTRLCEGDIDVKSSSSSPIDGR